MHLLPEFVPVRSADSWAISNPPIFSLAPLRSSFAIFDEAGGMEKLRAKSVQLTGYLQFLLDQTPSEMFTVITPRDAERARLSALDPGARHIRRSYSRSSNQPA